MISAPDSSLLLDILTEDARFAPASERALGEARRAGAVVVCPAVWAEVRGQFATRDAMEHAFASAEIQFDPFVNIAPIWPDSSGANTAGRAASASACWPISSSGRTRGCAAVAGS